MCKVIEDMCNQEYAEGRAEIHIDNIKALMEASSVSAEKAMELLKIPVGERENLLKNCLLPDNLQKRPSR